MTFFSLLLIAISVSAFLYNFNERFKEAVDRKFLVIDSIADRIGILGRNMVCKNCGWIGRAYAKNRANSLILIILLCFFIIPGVIYFIWGSANKSCRCPECRSWNMIPANSQLGQKIVKSAEKPFSKIEKSGKDNV